MEIKIAKIIINYSEKKHPFKKISFVVPPFFLVVAHPHVTLSMFRNEVEKRAGDPEVTAMLLADEHDPNEEVVENNAEGKDDAEHNANNNDAEDDAEENVNDDEGDTTNADEEDVEHLQLLSCKDVVDEDVVDEDEVEHRCGANTSYPFKNKRAVEYVPISDDDLADIKRFNHIASLELEKRFLGLGVHAELDVEDSPKDPKGKGGKSKGKAKARGKSKPQPKAKPMPKPMPKSKPKPMPKPGEEEDDDSDSDVEFVPRTKSRRTSGSLRLKFY